MEKYFSCTASAWFVVYAPRKQARHAKAYTTNLLMTWFASLANWVWENNWSLPRVKGAVLLYAALFRFVMKLGCDTPDRRRSAL